MDTASALPNGMGFSFAAQESNDENIRFAMAADSEATNHFLDSDLINELQQTITKYVKIESPVVITAAGNNVLHGVGKSTLLVLVKDQQGRKRPVQLPAIVVPGMGRHLFPAGTAAKKGVSTVIAQQSHLD